MACLMIHLVIPSFPCLKDPSFTIIFAYIYLNLFEFGMPGQDDVICCRGGRIRLCVLNFALYSVLSSCLFIDKDSAVAGCQLFPIG